MADLSSEISGRIFPVLLETFLYAIFTLLITVSSRTLIKRGLRNPASKAMLFVTVLTFILSTICWACDLRVLWNDLKLISSDDFSDSASPFVTATSPSVNGHWEYLSRLANAACTILSDALMTWRAWIVCGKDNRFAIFAVVMLGGFLANTFIMELATAALYFPTLDDLLPLARSNYASHSLVGWISISAAINVLSTAVIGCRIWSHRKDVHQVSNDASRKKFGVEDALTIILDTGVLYTLLWIITLAVTIYGLFSLEHHRFLAEPFHYYLVVVMNQVTGIYPTVIVILIASRKSQFTDQFVCTDTNYVLRAGRVNSKPSEFFVRIPGDVPTSQGVVPFYRSDESYPFAPGEALPMLFTDEEGSMYAKGKDIESVV